ncbi:MAG: cytidylyltransferase domain-containing protein [Armatimonadota bacterium]
MVAGVIQARMTATRLPGKTLKKLSGRSLLAWTILSTRACPSIDSVIVATSVNESDDPIVREAWGNGAVVYRGEEDDVLQRYLDAIDDLGLDTIVRICGDAPIFSPWVADGVIQEYHQSGKDYVSNTHKETFPYGTQAEVFSAEVLKRSAHVTDRPTDHEHVTPALRRRTDLFSCLSIVAPEPINRGRYRLCVDTPTDYEAVCEVFESLDHEDDLPPDLVDVVEFLDERDELTDYMYKRHQKYSTSKDAKDAPPTIELSMDYRRQFYEIRQTQAAK